MRPVRVLHCLEATRGGTARHLEIAARTLPGLGVDLHAAVSPTRNPEFPGALRALLGPERVHVVPMGRSIRPGRDAAAYRALVRVVRAVRPDLVHTHASKAGFLGRRAAHACGLPAVHTPHVYATHWARGARKGLYAVLERVAARWTSALVALHEEQVHAARALGVPEARIACIPNGVETDRFAPPSPAQRARIRQEYGFNPQTRVVGTLSRLDAQKGVDVFLRAAAATRRAFPYARFLIAGSGPLEGELRAQARAMRFGDQVRFLGPREDVQALYHGLDVFALTSRWEGMPYAILEAMACGLPVVATGTAGARALVAPGHTGSLAPVGDVEALAGAICAYLGDARLREREGRRARELVCARYTARAWARAHLELYQQVLAGD